MHLVDANDEDVATSYRVVRDELEAYGEGLADKPVVVGGQLVVRKMMTATLSGDHRAIDGALGAEYLKLLKGLLERPMRLLF